ncbi:MAG: GlsB/YeaQ/YmgE family stress response membrane protein [Bdellovibrionota bacterium]
MEIIIFLIIGLISGWLAGVLVQGHGLGTLGNIVIGVIGSFLGGYIFNMSGVNTYGLLGSIAMSVVGAVVFLLIVGLFSGPGRLQRH